MIINFLEQQTKPSAKEDHFDVVTIIAGDQVRIPTNSDKSI